MKIRLRGIRQLRIHLCKLIRRQSIQVRQQSLDALQSTGGIENRLQTLPRKGALTFTIPRTHLPDPGSALGPRHPTIRAPSRRNFSTRTRSIVGGATFPCSAKDDPCSQGQQHAASLQHRVFGSTHETR